MNDSLTKLLESIEPKIVNIQENRVEIKSLGEVYQTITEIVELGKKSYIDILEYYDQEFIIKTIKLWDEDADKKIKKYEGCKYLLKNRDPNLQDLPQYKESIYYMESLFKYLYGLYKEIKLEFESKKEDLRIQELLNKYFILLHKNNIFLEDIEEFLTFLDLCSLDIKDRLNILVYINKCNIKNYTTTNDIMLTNDIKLSDITNLLRDYKDLLSTKIDLKDQIPSIDLKLNEFDEETLHLKKIYLLRQINNLYNARKFDELIKYYLEFNKVIDYLKELKLQKTRYGPKQFKKLVFVLKNGKSLVREYLESCEENYKNCVYKNLLDLEAENTFVLPKMCYDNTYLYIKDEFVVKTVYTYLDNGYVLILGVLDCKENLEKFIDKNKELFNKILKEKDSRVFEDNERELLLKDRKIEDLISTIDLNTLDVKMEEKDAR